MPRTKTFEIEPTLHKAVYLFWENGFKAVSIQDLVDGLGINRASIYSTYGSKEELFKKAFDLYFDTNKRMAKEFLNKYEEPKTAFKDLFQMSIELNLAEKKERKGCLLVNSITELLPQKKEFDSIFENSKSDMVEIFADYIEAKSQSKSSIKSNSREIASYLFTLYSGLNVMAKVEAEPQKLHATVDIALKIFD